MAECEWHDAVESGAESDADARPPKTSRIQTQNQRALVVTMLLFSLVVLSQFVGAFVSHSRALLIDAASMLVDVATYATNLWVECAPTTSVRQAETREVAVSGISLLALWTITLIGAAQAIAALRGRGLSGMRAPEDGAANHGVDGRIVLGFALLGLAVDVFSLLEFNRSWRQARRAEAEADVVVPSGSTAGAAVGVTSDGAVAVEEARSTCAGVDASKHRARACARARGALGCCALELNMSSALTHVLADTFRSTTTLVESLLILCTVDGRRMNSVAVDGLAAVIVAAVIMLTALGTTKRWAETCWRLACAPRLRRPLSTREVSADCQL